MRAEGLQAILTMGGPNPNGNASLYSAGTFSYLSDFFTMTLNALLVVPIDRPAVMLVPTDLAEDRARRVAWVKDVRHSLDYAGDIGKCLDDLGISSGKIGVVGLDMMPAGLYHQLTKRHPDIAFVESAPLIMEYRHKKSALEQELVSMAAKINHDALGKMVSELRPGMTETEAVCLIEAHQRSQGADGVFNIISSGDFGAEPAARAKVFLPGNRRIVSGDCVIVEISCSYGGYWSQIVRVLTLGSGDANLHGMQQAAMKTLEAGIAELRPGTPINVFFNTMVREAARLGYKMITPTGHLCGMDLVEMRIDGKVTLPLDSKMTFICHPFLEDSDGRWLFWGHSFVMTAEGAKALHPGDEMGLYVV